MAYGYAGSIFSESSLVNISDNNIFKDNKDTSNYTGKYGATSCGVKYDYTSSLNKNHSNLNETLYVKSGNNFEINL